MEHLHTNMGGVGKSGRVGNPEMTAGPRHERSAIPVELPILRPLFPCWISGVLALIRVQGFDLS